jgi:parvulin-like peptidyl-prolyl isomerase
MSRQQLMKNNSEEQTVPRNPAPATNWVYLGEWRTLIRVLVTSGLAVASCLAGVAVAQEPARTIPTASSGNSATTSAKKDSATSDRVVLKVGDIQVTQAEFESRIGDIEPQGGDADKEEPNEKNRRRLGDDYASVLMLSQQAVANRLDSTPEVSRQLAIDRIQILSDAEFASLMRQAAPTREEISQYYAAHPSDYDEVKILRLFIWKRGAGSKNARGLSAQDARARADAILQASAAGRDAKNLTAAFKDSDDGMLDRDPIAFPRGELPPNMEKAAFAIKEGEWAQAEDTPDAIILLQLVKRDRQPLGQVSSLIEQQLQGQKMQALLEGMKKNAGIWMDEQYFGTAVAPVPGEQRRSSNPPSELRKSAKKGENNDEDATQK